MISDWLAFWDGRHFLYANARHKDAHYRLVAQAIAALVPSGAARCAALELARVSTHCSVAGETPSPAVVSGLKSPRAGPGPGAG